MKRAFLFLCVFILVFSLFTGCKKEEKKEESKAVVVVNGEEVGVGEFECYMFFVKNTIIASGGEDTAEYWNTFEIEGKKAGDVVKETALKNAIEYTIMAQEAEKVGVDNSDAMRNKQRQIVIDDMFSGDETAYKDWLNGLGLNDKDFTNVIMKIYLSDELASKAEIDEPTDTQIKEYYSENYFRAKHIHIAYANYMSDESDGRQEALDKINSVKTMLDEGGDFDALLAEYNEDPGMTDDELGYVFTKEGNMPLQFVEAVVNMDEGSISGIVETDFGFHIIKRLNAEEVFDEFLAQSVSEEGYTGKDEITAFVKNNQLTELVEHWKEKADIKTNEKKLESVKIVK